MTTRSVTLDGTPDKRWRGRPVLGWVMRAVIFLGPVAVGITTSSVLVRSLDAPRSSPWRIAWWVGIFAVSTAALYGADRFFRRLLPLATLLRLTILFPDQAPSRFGVARRSDGVYALRSRLERTRQHRAPEDAAPAEQLLSLVAALDEHDRRTRGHSERTAMYADLLAQEMKIPVAARDRLRWAALLHDIGKLYLPQAILNDKGRPDAAAWALIEQHPRDGAHLAAPLMDWLGEWGRAIGEHHERLDGTGYPERLRGSEVSLAARIVTVADTYETMTAGRPYRKPLSPSVAREEIARHAGTRYDPKVCRALMSISLGRSRRAVGVFGWLGQLPFALGFDRVGQAISTGFQTVSSAAVAAAGTASLIVSGVLTAPIAMGEVPPTPLPAIVADAPLTPALTAPPTVAPTIAPAVFPTAPPRVVTPTSSPPASSLRSIVQEPVATAAATVCASPVTAKATKDAWIVDDVLADNTGGDPTLVVQSKYRPDLPEQSSKQDRRALVAFDVPDAAAGCEITQAKLRLYAESASDSREIEARRVTSTWTEMGVVWANQPTSGETVATSTAATGWRTWDVTMAMRAGASHGFLIRDSVEGDSGFTQRYASRESAQHTPELVVRFGRS